MSTNETFLAVSLGGKTSPRIKAWDPLFDAGDGAAMLPEHVRGARNVVSHFWPRTRDDIVGQIFVALTLAAAAALILAP